MTIDLGRLGVRLVLLDVEGTTTPVDFVFGVLFPYARERMGAFLRDNADGAARDAIALLRQEHAGEAPDDRPPAWENSEPEAAARYAEWLMERDRKSPALKALQGMVWRAGYDDGTLRGEVFDDVPRALERWREAPVGAAIYSSGSVLAQKLLFSTTRFGDLTPLLAGFFDTAVGPKRSPVSYQRIARAVSSEPGSILFVSDVGAELAAAREAGLHCALCVRPGNRREPDSGGFPEIDSFDDIVA